MQMRGQGLRNILRPMWEQDKKESAEGRKVLASILKGANNTEVYSPARVTQVCVELGVVPG